MKNKTLKKTELLFIVQFLNSAPKRDSMGGGQVVFRNCCSHYNNPVAVAVDRYYNEHQP